MFDKDKSMIYKVEVKNVKQLLMEIAAIERSLRENENVFMRRRLNVLLAEFYDLTRRAA